MDDIKKYANENVSDTTFEETRTGAHGHNTSMTKEEVLYRTMFWKLYGRDNDHVITEIWRPRWTSVTDPSARLLIEKNPK